MVKVPELSHGLDDIVNVELQVAYHDNIVGYKTRGVDLFKKEIIDLRIKVEAWERLSITIDNINYLVDHDVLSDEQLAVVDVVLLEQRHDK